MNGFSCLPSLRIICNADKLSGFISATLLGGKNSVSPPRIFCKTKNTHTYVILCVSYSSQY